MDSYRVIYSQRALKDLAALIGYIAEDNTSASSSFGTALLDHIDLLSSFPHLGNAIPSKPRVRKLVHSPVIVYYRVEPRRRVVYVIHVRHGARKQPMK